MRILFLDQMASVTKQEMVEAFKMMLPGVQASISALNVIQKKMG
jgi:hypothetical protein